MKTMQWIAVVLLALFFSGPAVCGEPESKIATIDMNRVFTSFYKAKQVEARFNEAREQGRKELEEREGYLKDAEMQIAQLTAEINQLDLSEKEIEAKVKRLNLKAEEIESLRSSIEAFSQTRERQITEQANRSKNAILGEIWPVLAATVKRFDLVLDKSAHGIDEVKMVLFASESIDLTAEVIGELAKLEPEKKP